MLDGGPAGAETIKCENSLFLALEGASGPFEPPLTLTSLVTSFDGLRVSDQEPAAAEDETAADWQHLVERIQAAPTADPVEKSHVVAHLSSWLWHIPQPALGEQVLPVVRQLLLEKQDGPALQYDEYVKETLAPALDQIMLAFFSASQQPTPGRTNSYPKSLGSPTGTASVSPSPSQVSLQSTELTSDDSDLATIPIDAFSDVVIALLLDQNSFVASNARAALVRLTASLSDASPPTDDESKLAAQWQQYLVHGVILYLCSMESHHARRYPTETARKSDIFEPLANAMDGLDVDDNSFISRADETEEGSALDGCEDIHHHDCSDSGAACDNEQDQDDDDDDDDWAEKVLVAKLVALRTIADLTLTRLIESQDLVQACLEAVTTLSADAAMVVRKETVDALRGLGSVIVSRTSFDQVLDVFERLAADSTWHVRQAACRSLPHIFDDAKVDAETLSKRLPPIYGAFTTDSNTVQIAALDVSGPLIYLCHRRLSTIPSSFVEYYVGAHKQGPVAKAVSSSFDEAFVPLPTVLEATESTVEADWAADNDERTPQQTTLSGTETVLVDGWTSTSGEHERSLARAYNLPAVTLSLGAKRWPELDALYGDLCLHPNDNVRKSLAASQFELVKIVGCKEGSSHEAVMVESWARFVADTPLVQRAAVDQFANLVDAGSTSAHFVASCVSALVSVWPSIKDWRIRASAASQVASVCAACASLDDYESALALWSVCVNDPASAIRACALDALRELYQGALMSDRSTRIEQLREIVLQLASDARFRQRAFFCRAARVVVGVDEDELGGLIGHTLLGLAQDRVVDVRLAVAQTVTSLDTLSSATKFDGWRRKAVDSLVSASTESCIKECLASLATTASNALNDDAAEDSLSPQLAGAREEDEYVLIE